jgi:hypothetical protein
VPTRHDFTSDHPLPVFLSSDAERYEEPRRSSFLLKTAGLFVLAAIVIGAAVTLTLGNPMNLFAEASQADSAAAQPTADQSPPPVQAAPPQATADAGQTAGATASRDDVTAATDNAPEPPSGALLKQFQSWAAQQDGQPQAEAAQPAQGAQTLGVQTQVEPVRPIQDATPQAEPTRSVQGAPTTQVMQDDPPAPVRAAQKHRRARPVQNARAEIRMPRPRPVAGARPDRNVRADVRPPQDGRPVEQQPQAQSPSFLQSIGLRPQQ